MTLESLHIVESTPETELSTAERLVMEKRLLHIEMGQLAIERDRIERLQTEKIARSIKLNEELAAAGVDTYTLACELQAVQPHEESPLFSGEQSFDDEPYDNQPIPIKTVYHS